MNNILYKCIKCGEEIVYPNSRDGLSCCYCKGYLNLIGPTNKEVTSDRNTKLYLSEHSKSKKISFNEVKHKATILNQAIEILRDTEYENIECIGIQTSAYEDEIPFLTINVDFKKGE